MKNIKRIISRWLMGALFLGLLSACEQEKTLMYEQAAGVYFYGKAESEYSFVTKFGWRCLRAKHPGGDNG